MTEPLSTRERAALEQGLPRLSEWGDDLLVPFPIHQLRDAKVLWSNSRWFLERGIDVTDPKVLDRVNAWLVETFAYVAFEPKHGHRAVTGESKMGWADRYGSSSGLAKHGGSGRVAVYGCFQAKGVGPTPLIGDDAPADHSNGFVSLGEAIREAIYAEIMSAEFPYGAVPAIAVLDTGLHYFAPEPGVDGIQKVRRALIVRPSVVRPAHAERAPLYRRAITGNVDAQKSDVNRTRTVVRQWLRKAHDRELPSPLECVGRLAEQAAFAHVHRLYNGGFFSSNMAITGELHDFGNAYVLPDWTCARVLVHTPTLGKELESIDIITRSINFYFRKYDGAKFYQGTSEELFKHAKKRYDEAFARECLRVWQAESLAETEWGRQIAGLLHSFFLTQQRALRCYGWSGEIVRESDNANAEWIYEALVDLLTKTTVNPSKASVVVRQINELLLKGYEVSTDAEEKIWMSWLTAFRLLRPRQDVERGRILRAVNSLVSQLAFHKPNCAQQVTEFIQSAINSGRAHWPRLPIGLAVLAQVTRDGCTALMCSRGPKCAPFWWIEGPLLEGRVNVFDSWVPLGAVEIDPYGVSENGRYCSLLVPDIGTTQGAFHLVCVGGIKVKIPETTAFLPLGTVDGITALRSCSG